MNMMFRILLGHDLRVGEQLSSTHTHTMWLAAMVCRYVARLRLAHSHEQQPLTFG